MNFLPNVYVTCDVCRGRRYNLETLQVKYKGKSIADLLESTVDDALESLTNIPQVHAKLKTLTDVGLGYIHLGQSAVTLSGAVTTYQGRGDTGNATYRRFCPSCGSPVLDEAAVMADVVMIPVGTLDDPSQVKPTMQIYCDSAQPWALLEGGIQRIAKMPGPG